MNNKSVKYVRLKLFMSASEMTVAETLKTMYENDGYELVETMPSYMKYVK